MKVIRSGLVHLGRDSEEKREYMGGDLPWGVSDLSHRLGAPVLGSYTGEMSLLGLLESWDLKEG